MRNYINYITKLKFLLAFKAAVRMRSAYSLVRGRAPLRCTVCIYVVQRQECSVWNIRTFLVGMA